MAFGLSGACLTAVLAACGASSTDNVGPAPAGETRQQPEIVGQLAFIVWTCADLECLNLETAETTSHTYTACAAVIDDAQVVGNQICEGRRKSSSVMSSPATCTPLGTPCPSGEAALWDNRLKQRVDETAFEDAGVSGEDASVP